MPIDLQGQPYLTILDDKGTHRVAVETAGWQKELLFRGVFGKQKIYRPIRGRPTELKVSESYVFRIYQVRAPKCSLCDMAIANGKITESMDRIRKMSVKTGLYHRCFLGALASKSGVSSDYTEWFMDWDNARNWKLKKEIPVTREEVFALYAKGEIDYISDTSLTQELEAKLGCNL